MIYDRQTYIDMVRYQRPQDSKTQRKFCKRFLEPVFGKPDEVGNYILRVGNPKIAFMSHHDTVHKSSGLQVVSVVQDFATSNSNCLGADCTTGIYIMLRMIQAGVEGLYIVHASEEIGCLGSRYIATQTPDVVHGIDVAISFDRYGYSSIITHQMGTRTCSDEFARSLELCVDLGYKIDTGGVYTDSNEYEHIIPECTNVSVGYFSQHTTNEQQDLVFMDHVADSFINADWSKLVVARDPSAQPDYNSRSMFESYSYSDDDFEEMDIEHLVVNNPKSVARLLRTFGYDATMLAQELDQIRTYQY